MRPSFAERLLPWIMWGLCALFYCYGFFQRVAPSVMVGELMRDFGVGAAVLGNLSAFYFYAYAGLQLPVGVMVDRWGPRRMVASAAVLCGLGSLLFATADGLMSAYIGRLLIGAGAGFAWVGSLKLAGSWFPPRRFALVSGLTMMLGMIGAVGGQAPLAAVVAATGWRGALTAAGVFSLVLAVVIWVVVRDRPGVDRTQRSSATDGLLHGLGRTLASAQCWLVALFGFAMVAPMLTFGGLWGVPFMMRAFGLERPVAAASVSLMMVGWGIGAPLNGWFSDYIGRRKAPMLIGAIVALGSFAALVYLPGLGLLEAQGLLLLNGIVSGSMVLCFATVREQNTSEAAGSALGFVNAIVMGAGALFQPFIGWILDLNWDGVMDAGARVYSLDAYKSAFLVLVACPAIALVLALMIRETHCRPIQR